MFRIVLERGVVAVVALLTGIIILIMPKLLSYVIALFLIAIGIAGLTGWLGRSYVLIIKPKDEQASPPI
jgi:Protein of unknown function (DUF3096).